MPREKPKVIAGMRGPRDTRVESMQEIERKDSNPELAQVSIAGLDPKKGTLYLSKYPSYRVQITAPGDTINPVTGHRTRTRGITAVFKNGRFLNDGSKADPGASKKQREAVRQMIDDRLQSNYRFGKPGQADFWLAEEQETVLKERSLEQARKVFRSLPKEVVDAEIAALQKGDAADHEVPAPA